MYKYIVKRSIDYVTGIIKKGKKGIIIGGIPFLTFLYGTLALNWGSMLLSEKITNQTQLEIIVKEEASKLGMGNEKISAKFGEASRGVGMSRKFSDGSYEVVLDRYGRNRANVRHELYHIYARHSEDFERTNKLLWVPKEILVHETQAILYQSLGIRL